MSNYEKLKTFLENDKTHLMVAVLTKHDDTIVDVNQPSHFDEELVECLKCEGGSYILVTESKTIDLHLVPGDSIEYYGLVYSENPYLAEAWSHAFAAGLLVYKHKIVDGKLLTYNLDTSTYEVDENNMFLEDSDD